MNIIYYSSRHLKLLNTRRYNIISIMSNQTLIKDYDRIISDIQDEIKKLENETRVLNRNKEIRK